MNRPPPHERPAANELASPHTTMQIAGLPADVCPYCGAAMFATGTRAGEEVTFRYVHCRNKRCGRRFYAKQPPATIVRELDDSSSSGQTHLTIHKEAV